MGEKEMLDKEEIFSKVLRAGRRTYFFDVRETKAGDYYITVTESKKFTNEDGSYYYKKHKIYLYKEDFVAFRDILGEMTDYVINEKGQEVISERHQKDFKRDDFASSQSASVQATPQTTVKETVKETDSSATDSFTDISFDDI
jgi:hypothetical protein